MLDSLRLGLAAIGISASGVWMLSGSAQETHSFDLPASTVIERLNTSRRTVEGTGMGSLTLAGEEQFTLGKVKISVLRAGSARKIFCKVDVEATAEAASTANLDCGQPESGRSEVNQLAAQALKIVVDEHVVASVLGQAYDTGKVADRMIAFMARSAPALAASMPPPQAPAAPSRPRPEAVFQDDEDEAEPYGSAEPGYGEPARENEASGDASE